MCQIIKHVKRNYGKSPHKHTETQLWDKLCIDQISIYQIPLNKGGIKNSMER